MDKKELHIGDTIYHWSYGRMKIVDFYDYENQTPVSRPYSRAKYVWAEFLNRDDIVPPASYEDVSRTIEHPTPNRKTFQIQDQGYAFHTTEMGMLLIESKNIRPEIITESEPLGWLYPLKREQFHPVFLDTIHAIEDIEKLNAQCQEAKAEMQKTQNRIDRIYQSLDNLLEKTRVTVSPKFIENLRNAAKDALEQFDANINEKKLAEENPDKLKESLVEERGPLDVRFRFLEHMLSQNFAKQKIRSDWENVLKECEHDLLTEAKSDYKNPDAYKKFEEILENELRQMPQGLLVEFFDAIEFLPILEKVLHNRSYDQDLTGIKDKRISEHFADLQKEQRQLKTQAESVKKMERRLETAKKVLSDDGISEEMIQLIKQRLKDPDYIN